MKFRHRYTDEGYPPVDPDAPCRFCIYTAAGHPDGQCPTNAPPAGAGGRLDRVFGVTRELVEKFGSPLAKATIGAPTTEPLSRRYEAIVRRARQEQERMELAKAAETAERAREQAEALRVAMAKTAEPSYWTLDEPTQAPPAKQATPKRDRPVGAGRRYYDEG